MDSKDKSSLDEFWDIGKLIPQKKKIADFNSHTYDTTAVEVILTAKESTSDNKLKTIEMRPERNDEGKLTFIKPISEPQKPTFEYSPENPFIKCVKVFKRDDFGYYLNFFNDGNRYIEKVGRASEEPPFFSYVPQYSQLDQKQLNYYFYMRNELREGRSVEASYSYVLLYIFELLNIQSDREHALSQLCFVWQTYRKKHPKLDTLIREWITDYCLVYRLSPTPDILGDVYKVVIETSSLKELFLFAGKSKDELFSGFELTHALLELCTNYDWKKSRYATEENIQFYEKCIPGALHAVLASFKGRQGVFVGAGELKRDAFAGALCTPDSKFRIEVSYCSIARSHEMRFLVSDVIKHTENRIRGYLGIKSKLTIYSLPTDVRKCIDDYMNTVLPGKRVKKNEEVQEYDKFYDIPKREFSLENAKQIEESSWQTTQILVEAFEETEEEPVRIEPELENVTAVISDHDISEEERLRVALSLHMDFVIAALAEDFGKQSLIAREKGRMIDSIADEINEISADIFGDIILEKNGVFYTVIEDYKEVFE